MNKLIKNIGFDKNYLVNTAIEDQTRVEVARVISVQKERYILSNGQFDFAGELLGRLIYNAESPLDFPTVGDWVYVDSFEENNVSLIHEVLTRKSLLKRKTSGKKIDFQLIAANIEVAFIMQSLDNNFNINRLERYLVLTQESKIQPLVLLSKSDLQSEKENSSKVKDIKELFPGLKVYSFSNNNSADIEMIKNLLIPAKTYCLLGSSGVGKTSLLNNLIGKKIYDTRSVREKDNRGRHATSSRQLIKLECGAMIIDTPGMRELGNISSEEGIKDTFLYIFELSEKCYFKNCSHSNEHDCAVLLAIKNGDLSEKKYKNYLKLKKETAFNDMSYIEKRHNDRKLSKLYKTIMKQKKENKSN